ncbi:phosphatase PAP2 family protein [Streptomyces sp. NPDC059957]|uniref:phosphatase PAP2 family protein n=1 Tax=unclassified Streptomyces TaxID=2593676 RepID=UPI003659FE07
MDSSGLYLDVTDFAHSTPAWVQSAFEFWTEYGLLVFGALFIAVWWRSRGARDPRAVALAVLAPFVTALAYVASELVKSSVDEERPCRAVAGAAASLIKCPATGDWSFPSNHATIAGAAAVALALAGGAARSASTRGGGRVTGGRKLVLLTVPPALLMAFSRVFVGVHYPHDVAMGLLLGASLAALAALALAGPATRVVAAVRTGGGRTAVLITGPDPAR